jgi:histidinol phosphatase-like PHP family hydrolase
MDAQVYNLHNHTPFSDGAYTIDELCEAHLSRKDVSISGIGISDALFRTPASREPANDREFLKLFEKETRDYVKYVHEARQRWEKDLKIFCGAEVNWPLNKGHLGLIRSMLEGIDFVLFNFVDWAGLTQLASHARRFPCPVGLSQTDVSESFPNTPHEQVVRTMANARMFYEVNAVHLSRLSLDPWYSVLPKHRVLVALGTDTHDDLTCLKSLRPMVEHLHAKGLAEKILHPGPRQFRNPAPRKQDGRRGQSA